MAKKGKVPPQLRAHVFKSKGSGKSGGSKKSMPSFLKKKLGRKRG